MNPSGIGLEKSQMEKLFTPFAQLQDFAGGTGLGLYSVKRKVEALGMFQPNWKPTSALRCAVRSHAAGSLVLQTQQHDICVELV
jgi:hypothetical protein